MGERYPRAVARRSLDRLSPMVKVLLIDPALATVRDRFAERLPADVEVLDVFYDGATRPRADDA